MLSFFKAKAQPRVPRGSPDGGQFASSGPSVSGSTGPAADGAREAMTELPVSHRRALEEAGVREVRIVAGLTSKSGRPALGLYDTETKELRLESGQTKGSARSTATHEAGHAVDQRLGWASQSAAFSEAHRAAVGRVGLPLPRSLLHVLGHPAEAFAETYALVVQGPRYQPRAGSKKAITEALQPLTGAVRAALAAGGLE